VKTIYEVPLKMLAQDFDKVTLDKLNLPHKNDPETDLVKWRDFVDRVKNSKEVVHVGLIGKYTELPDAYKSIIEAFVHAGAANNVKVKLHLINSEKITRDNVENQLKSLSGILVAPGFGHRGIDGKIEAVRYAREHGLPFFGICLGMQCAVIEYARNVLGYNEANSTEMGPTKVPVIDIMEDQKGVTDKGGTMRLGAYLCQLTKGTAVYKAYSHAMIAERHRHRYEFNNAYIGEFEKAGLRPVGINPETNLVEVVELNNHPWFIGVQYHPEYKSTVKEPHPLFVSFIRAAVEYGKKING
jgi:CTP synthase